MSSIIHFLFKLFAYLLGIVIILVLVLKVGFFAYKSFNDEYFQVGQTVPHIPHATHWNNLGKQCWNGCWGQIGFQLDIKPEKFKEEYLPILKNNDWKLINIDESVPDRIAVKVAKQIKGISYAMDIDYDLKASSNTKYKNSWIYINK